MAQPHAGAPETQDSLRGEHRNLIAARVPIVGVLAGVIGGYLAGSLVLLAHAGHMLADAVSVTSRTSAPNPCWRQSG